MTLKPPTQDESLSVVDVKNLSKSYRLFRSRSARLIQLIADILRIRVRLFDEFESVADASFRIGKGETFAIIGQNGSGKSTLLQIISGVLAPTKGSVKVRGRIAALLELGAGFNPEFTGRENVILNCQLLGMSRDEVEGKLPAIFEFAEIGAFVDQPVKTYSSGMYVRLAFAAAIHTEPSVLIIDEALAVGDARFQRKCYQKLEEIKKSGTTILVVSHDLSVVKRLADQVLVLERGRTVFLGNAQDAAVAYFNLMFPNAVNTGGNSTDNQCELVAIRPGVFDAFLKTPSFGEGGGRYVSIRFEGAENLPNLVSGTKLKLTMRASWNVERVQEIINTRSYPNNIILSFSLSDKHGTYIFGCTTIDKEVAVPIESGEAQASFSLEVPYLADGDYFLNAALALGTQENHTQLCWYEAFQTLRIESNLKNVYGLMYVQYNVSASNS